MHADGYLVLESVNFPGSHIGVKDNGTIQFPSKTGKGKDAQFKVQVIMEQPEYHRVGTSLLEVCICPAFKNAVY